MRRGGTGFSGGIRRPRLPDLAVGRLLALAVVGVPSTDLHGPLHRIGIMDPACGGTRSVFLFLHGDLTRALHYNPAGPIVVLAAALIVLRTGAGWLTGAGSPWQCRAVRHYWSRPSDCWCWNSTSRPMPTC